MLEPILSEITAEIHPNGSFVSSGGEFLLSPSSQTSSLTSPHGAAGGKDMVTNALMVSSPYKLVAPPSESMWNPWQAEAQKAELTAALYAACTDCDLYDVYLTAQDGSQVPASRFVLASRSPVLKRMLYGSFREASSSTISMSGYEKAVLQAVVDYCHKNGSMPILPRSGDIDLDAHIRQYVRLYQCADFLELGLTDLVHQEIRRLTGLYPGLACVVYDEVEDVHSRVGEYARTMMEVRPYVSLGAGTRTDMHRSGTPTSSGGRVDLDDDVVNPMGGVECLRAERLKLVFESPNLSGGELFLFHMLRQWYEYKIGYLEDHVKDKAELERQKVIVTEAALECAKHLYLENIEPADLLQVVQPCPFISINPGFLFEAFAKQALRASQHREWALHSRPEKHQAHERVLVEGCGSVQARGMYIRMVSGLKKSNATLYTKREVISGQAMVYTLSCSVNQDVVECRIFCSPLLTPQAIPMLYNFNTPGQQVDSDYKPIVQVVAIKPASGGNGNRKTGRTVVLSDGHHCMQGTLAYNMAVHNAKEISLYGVLQLLAFKMYKSSNSSRLPKIYIQRVSVVNSDAGQVFGRPTFAATPGSKGKDIASAIALDDDAESRVPESLAGEEIAAADCKSVVSNEDTYMVHHYAAVKDLKHVTVLYSCSYPLNKARDIAKEGRVPKMGWQVEEVAQEPPPICTWFAPAKKTPVMSWAAATAAVSFISGISSLNHHNNNNQTKKATAPATPDKGDDPPSAVSRGLQKLEVASSQHKSTSSGGRSAMEALLQYGSGDDHSEDNHSFQDSPDDDLDGSPIRLSSASSDSYDASTTSPPPLQI